jgi:putative ABC transport system substrate-binding protein
MLIVIDHTLITNNASDIGPLIVKHSIPSVHRWNLRLPLGGLVSYGHDVLSNFRRAAYFVDRILKGTRPADLPIEVPVVFELAVNLKRAKELGISMPVALVSRADKVIE